MQLVPCRKLSSPLVFFFLFPAPPFTSPFCSPSLPVIPFAQSLWLSASLGSVRKLLKWEMGLQKLVVLIKLWQEEWQEAMERKQWQQCLSMSPKRAKALSSRTKAFVCMCSTPFNFTRPRCKNQLHDEHHNSSHLCTADDWPAVTPNPPSRTRSKLLCYNVNIVPEN